MAQYTKQQLISASNAAYFTNVYGGISASAVRDLNDSWISSSALLSGSNTFIGNQIISGTMTAQLPANYIWLGDSNGYNQAVATSSISLQGAQGIQGLQGLQGTQGIQGITGLQGLQGLQGIQGLQGLQGTQGITGLQGIQGTNGLTGSNGAQGTQGIQGIQGADNSTQGTQGVQGFTGAQGIQGIQGTDNSTQGAQGTQGVQGVQGSGANIDTGSFATTGSNTFTGQQVISPTAGMIGLSMVSSSIYLNGNGRLQFPNGTFLNGDINDSFNFTQDTDSEIARGMQFSMYGGYNRQITFQNTSYNTGSGQTGNIEFKTRNGNQGSGSINFTTLSGSMEITPNYIRITGSALEMQGFTYPTTDGTNGQVLTTNGSKTLTFTTVASSIDTGSFATTGSNTFRGDQTINGILTVSSSANSYLQFTSPNNQTGSGQIFFGSLGPYIQTFSGGSSQDNMGLQLVGGLSGSFAMATRYGGPNATIELDAMNDQTNPATTRGRIQVRTNGQIDLTGFGGAISLSGSGTIIQGLTYPGTDGTNGQVITTNGSGVLTFTSVSGSGGSINTGSFATTGSNVFTGDQTISKNGGVYNMIDNSNPSFGTASFGISGASGGLVFKQSGSIVMEGSFPKNLTFYGTGSFVRGIKISDSDFAQGATIIYNTTTNTFGMLDESGATSSLDLEGTFTASLAQGYAWVGNSSNRTTLVATSSFGGGGGDTGSLLVTASFDTTTRDITFTKGDATTFKLGAFAITGSNVFTGKQTIPALDMSGSITFPNGAVIGPNSVGQATLISSQTALQLSSSVNATIFASALTFDAPKTDVKGVATINNLSGIGVGEVYLLGRSGSLILSNTTATPTYASLNHLSSSQVNANTNIIFKTNTLAADTIISGSNNIFTNPTAPTAGFKRYVGGSGNLMLNPVSVNQISASQAFPITTNFNIHTAGLISTRGPVSASAWNINQNILVSSITVGSNAGNATKLLGNLAVGSNFVGSGLTITANRTAISASTNIITNAFIGGQTTLNMASSSISYNANIGSAQITNGFEKAGAATGNNSLQVQQNWLGAAVINVSGSDAGGLANPRYIANNYLFQGFNLSGTEPFANLSLNGSGSSMLSTMAMGHALGITGSNGYDSNENILTPGIGAGSAFFGRWNAQDGNRARTAETVFAIGTGTSTSLTKTGFLIDSGSNSYFEGTLNVSGSTAMNGNQDITGSLLVSSFTTLASVSSSLNFADDTAAAAGGVPLGGLYRNGNFVMIRLT